MSFNPNIPQTTEFILQSFSQLRANFQSIDNAFSSNHASMSGNEDIAGKHTIVTLRPQSGDPTTGANQTALYTKIVSSVSNLFFAPNNSQTPIQLTYPSIIRINGPGLNQTHQYFMAGPFLVYGGFINNPTNNQLVTLSPGSSLIYVDLTIGFYNKPPILFPITVAPTNVAGMSFNISYPTGLPTSTKFGVYYLAIGLP